MEGDSLISLEADLKAVRKALKANLVRAPKINEKMLKAAVTAGRNEEKKRVYKSVKKGTGDLKKAIYSNVSKRGKYKGEGYIRLRSIYAANMVYGNEILPQTKKFLAFEIEGDIIRTDRVYIPPKWDFFGEVEAFYRSDAPRRKMENVMGKELERLWPS